MINIIEFRLGLRDFTKGFLFSTSKSLIRLALKRRATPVLGVYFLILVPLERLQVSTRVVLTLYCFGTLPRVFLKMRQR